MSFGILTDLSKCIGCEACARACKEVNRLAGTDISRLSATSLTIVEHHGEMHIRRQCMHCNDPTCASVCPVAALQKTEAGPVVYHEDRCIGCRYCIMACPFEVPKYEWDSTSPSVKKCTMCSSRLERGEQPGCTSVCPTGATTFGQRNELIEMAQERLRREPGRYVQHIYGLKEAGGTSVIYISDVPFERLGFKAAATDVSYPQLTWTVLSQLPSVVSVGGVLMCGIWWITHRRMKLAAINKNAQETKLK